jgi:uncharacterized protein YycO
MNTIQVCFFSGTSIIAYAIRFLTWSKYHHVGLILPDGYYWEAGTSEGVCSYLKQSIPYSYNIYEIQVDDNQYEKIKSFLVAQKGKPYDWSGFLRFLFPQKLDCKYREAWFCSEFVFCSFSAAGISLINDKIYRVSPKKLSISPLLVSNFK